MRLNTFFLKNFSSFLYSIQDLYRGCFCLFCCWLWCCWADISVYITYIALNFNDQPFQTMIKLEPKYFFISNDLKSHAHQLLRKTWHNFGILTAHIITSFHTLLRNIENISLIIWSKKEYHTQYLNIIKISVVNKKGISLLGSVMQKLEKWMYNFWRSINNCLLLVVLWHLK